MNRFFTLLLAASCLTAVGQSEYCLDGTVWDDELQGCIVANPADINFDGCVQLNDLLDLLLVFGDCAAQESAWQCGDPIEYQGYDYETVQIGEQCWFAENLKADKYQNGESILSDATGYDTGNGWGNTLSGAMAIYGEGESTCSEYAPDGDACDETWSLQQYGALYNWFAVADTRQLCPNGWYVPSDEDWFDLELNLGLSLEDLDAFGARGTDEGDKLKSTEGWYNGGNGDNSSGFTGLPGGVRTNPEFTFSGFIGYWWTSTGSEEGAFERRLYFGTGSIYRENSSFPNTGRSVRCIKDTE